MNKEEALAAVAQRRTELSHARHVAQEAAQALEEAIVSAVESGASQRVTAENANVSQPYVSKLVKGRRGFVPRSKLGQLLASRRAEVLRVVRGYGADNVVVFGSVAAGTDSSDSDIDLMVDIPDDMGLFTLGQMEHDVRDVLGVDVDVIPSRLARPRVLGSAAKTAVPL